MGEYKVEFVDIGKDVEKIKLTFEGSEIICSLTHKFYVNNLWKEAQDMVIGDEVSDKKLVAIEDVENGDVVHITIEDAHTYICEDLLSHNKRRPNPNKGGGRRGGIKRGPRPDKTDKPTGGRGPRRDPPRGERGGRGGRRSDPRREKVYHPIVKSKTPKDQRPVKEDRGPVNITGGRGGRRSTPRPDRDRNRGRRRVRDEAFRRRRTGGSPRRISREERRRRVRVANTRK